MNTKEIAVMLSFASTLDGRVPFDEVGVTAWAHVLEPDIENRWAADFVKRHYGRTSDMLIPSVLNKGWLEHKRNQRLTTLTTSESHCQRLGCTCTHTDACFKGWLDIEDRTVPCSICRSSLAVVLQQIPPLGHRQEHDEARIRNRFKEMGND
jgi:hypothetical protein